MAYVPNTDIGYVTRENKMNNKLYHWQLLAASLELADYFTHVAANAARFRHGRDDFDDKDIQKVLAIHSQIWELRRYFYDQLNAEDQKNWKDHLDIFYGDALRDAEKHKYTKEKHEIEVWLLKDAAEHKSTSWGFETQAILSSLDQDDGDIEFEDID